MATRMLGRVAARSRGALRHRGCAMGMGTAAHRRALARTASAGGGSPNPAVFFGGIAGIGGLYAALYYFRNDLRSAAEEVGIVEKRDTSDSTFKLEGATLTEIDAWKLFRLIDETGDGNISKRELRKFFLNTDKYRYKKEQAYAAVNHFFTVFDRDNSATIDFGEFLEILRMDEIEVKGNALARSDKVMRELYATFDRDGDAVVTVADFDAFLGSLKSLIYVADRDAVSGANTDEDHDGIIDYGEFATMWYKVAAASFKAFDTDGNGTLSRDEIARMLNRPSIDPLKSTMMRKFDQDHDGRLNFDEFFQFYTYDALQQYKSRQKADKGWYVFGVRVW